MIRMPMMYRNVADEGASGSAGDEHSQQENDQAASSGAAAPAPGAEEIAGTVSEAGQVALAAVAAAPGGLVAAAVSGIDEWFSLHAQNNAISQNTPAYNQIFQGVSTIKDALGSIKE